MKKPRAPMTTRKKPESGSRRRWNGSSGIPTGSTTVSAPAAATAQAPPTAASAEPSVATRNAERTSQTGRRGGKGTPCGDGYIIRPHDLLTEGGTVAIDLTITIAGEGGEGVISSGDFLMQAATRAGMEVVTFKSFPSEIKGGYALSQLRISDEKILSQGDGFNILVAFNGEAYSINKPLLTPGTVLVWDGPHGDFEPEPIPGVTMYNVPMTHISKQELKNPIVKNMVAMGPGAGVLRRPR